MYYDGGTRPRQMGTVKVEIREFREKLASHLPPGHVLTLTGGHDWRTWRRLWQSFLSMWTVR